MCWREVSLFVGDLVRKKLCLTTIFSILLCSVASGRQTYASGQQTYDDYLSQAKSLIAQQKYPEAVAETQKAIALNGGRWEAYVVAAKGYSSQKLYDDAIGMLQTALIRAPEDKKPAIRDAIAECRKELNPANVPSQASSVNGETPLSSSPETAPTQAEIVLWKSIENSSQIDDFKAYLTQYPNGAFVALAKSHIDRLRPQEEAASKTADEHRQALARGLIIHVYRPKHAHSNVGAVLYVDGIKTAEVDESTLVGLKLAAVSHRIYVVAFENDKDKSEVITVEPGKEYWMRLDVNIGRWQWDKDDVKFQIVPPEQAQSEIGGFVEVRLRDLSEK